MPTPTRPLVHLELHCGDLPLARAFYAGLCGWKMERVDTGGGAYDTLDMGPGIGGGIVENDRGRSLWLPYVEVAEISQATERAREMGASVVLEPREGPVGWRSVVGAPATGEVALWQQKR